MCGARIFANSLKLQQEFAPVWTAKCKELQKKIEDFRFVALGFFTRSLKLHQEWTPVWRAERKDLQTKIKDFKCVCGAGIIAKL